MGTSSKRVFNGSRKGYLPAGTIGNRTHILSERLKAGTEFKRLKKGHRPAPMPLKQTHILSYKPISAEPSIKEKDPFAEVLVNSRWRGRESRPRAARTDRCGAYAPCELRWQTLTRLLSSAPSRGSIPCGGCIKEKDPFSEVLVNSRWRGRESNP